MRIETVVRSARNSVRVRLPKPPQLADSGKTARKPNGYRVSGFLNLGRLVLDSLQKKAASICGL